MFVQLYGDRAVYRDTSIARLSLSRRVEILPKGVAIAYSPILPLFDGLFANRVQVGHGNLPYFVRRISRQCVRPNLTPTARALGADNMSATTGDASI